MQSQKSIELARTCSDFKRRGTNGYPLQLLLLAWPNNFLGTNIPQ